MDDPFRKIRDLNTLITHEERRIAESLLRIEEHAREIAQTVNQMVERSHEPQ